MEADQAAAGKPATMSHRTSAETIAKQDRAKVLASARTVAKGRFAKAMRRASQDRLIGSRYRKKMLVAGIILAAL